MAKVHIVIDEVDNGWLFSVAKHTPFSQEAPTPRVMVSPTFEDVILMLHEELKKEEKGVTGWRR